MTQLGVILNQPTNIWHSWCKQQETLCRLWYMFSCYVLYKVLFIIL
jgi:hypothetical protein